MRCRCHLLVLSVSLSAAAGCHSAQPDGAASEALTIPVSKPVSREINDYVYYTGRADAVQSVEVRARATGYLTKMPFKEGSEVKKGDLLFEIDPRPYQADYDANVAQVELREASYRLAKSESARSKAIARNTAGAISNEELEKSLSQEAQALAQLNVAKATLKLAKLNLDFTEVTSPIDGHISRYNYTVGNLVMMDQTLLTTVVSVDPMYVFYDMDERTILRIREGINKGKIPVAKDTTDIPVNMGLEGEDGYPHRGHHNFVNNVVNLSTGTVTVRGVFPNPKPDGGRRLLMPGLFVRIQLPVGPPHKALLVIDRALGSDQGLRFVYVLDNHNKVQYRRVSIGPLQDDGLRPIEAGLTPDDWVVIGGLTQVRPLEVVEPERVPMPSLGTVTGGQAPGATPPRPQPPPPGKKRP